MIPVLSEGRIQEQSVQLLSVEMSDSLSRCVHLACSTEYHLTGEYYKSSDPLSLAALLEKTLVIYNEVDSTLIAYNTEGSGCILLSEKDSVYRLITMPNSNNEYMTCFSKLDPIVSPLIEKARWMI